MRHATGTREDWLAARIELLAEEKELTRRSDELARKRQALPWVVVEEEYAFETEDGPRSLAELFDGRDQLLDRIPHGRRDDPEGWPRRHDEYAP